MIELGNRTRASPPQRVVPANRRRLRQEGVSEAQARDIPRGRVLKDEALSEIADAVGQVRGMDSDAVLLGTLLGVLEKARAALATTDEETT